MKDRLNPQQPAGLVWTARKEVPARTYLSCDARKDNDSVYNAATGGKYKVICGQDVDAGDIGYVGGVSFEEGMDACDATAKCKDVALSTATAIRKVRLGWVWTGYLIPEAPLSCVVTRMMESCILPPAATLSRYNVSKTTLEEI